MAYWGFKDSNEGTASYNVLRDKEFNISENLKYDEYHVDLFQWFINFLIKELLVEPLRLQISLQLKLKIFLTKTY